MQKVVYKHADEVEPSIEAAGIVVPHLIAIIGKISSVLDLGGGTGGWLREFSRHGVSDIRLVDHPSVATNLLIPPEKLKACNLESEFPPPWTVDLAMSIECAEHLSVARAQPLVEFLTSCADVVVFSAAVPGQKGKRHINERPHRYWKSLFEQQGFYCHDVIRPRLQHDKRIPYWYRQNMFLYVRSREMCESQPFIADDMVLLHENVQEQLMYPGVRRAIRLLLASTSNALGRRFGLNR